MTNALTRLLGAGAVLAVLSAAPVMAQEDLSEWDADGDGILTEEEFSEAWDGAGTFDEWDVDGDGVLSEEEFRQGVFDAHDEDDDGELDEEEFAAAEDEDFWGPVILCPEEQAEQDVR
ncbi:MAG: EF-hand domain-containing protein [Alphaproteobacteria bacterium]